MLSTVFFEFNVLMSEQRSRMGVENLFALDDEKQKVEIVIIVVATLTMVFGYEKWMSRRKGRDYPPDKSLADVIFFLLRKSIISFSAFSIRKGKHENKFKSSRAHIMRHKETLHKMYCYRRRKENRDKIN